MSKLETRFTAKGSLEKPRLIGRLVRLGLGFILLSGFYSLWRAWPVFIEAGVPF